MAGNYPAGVTDNDPHFDLPSGDEVEYWQCASCHGLLSVDMVDNLGNHRRIDEGPQGEPVVVHCGPCEPVSPENQ